VMRVRVESWAAIAPGVQDVDAWRDWARAPAPFVGEARPEVRFLPAMQRRRCDTLSRLMLAAANGCCPEDARGDLPSVFASRHGSFGTTVSMLEKLARDEPLSPTAFSHSVHNTQAGLFSIWAGNQQVAQSLASRSATFEHGFLEAVCLGARSEERRVLLVTGDEALPEPVADLSDDPDPPYAVALLLHVQPPDGESLGFSIEHEPPASFEAPAWPRAIEFLRWWLGSDEVLRLGAAPRSFTWRRRR
jgi:hypothetical protein